MRLRVFPRSLRGGPPGCGRGLLCYRWAREQGARWWGTGLSVLYYLGLQAARWQVTLVCAKGHALRTSIAWGFSHFSPAWGSVMWD